MQANMDFFNQLLTFLGSIASVAGALLAAVGVYRWISGGKEGNASQQESATWTILLGGATIAIGIAIASGALKIPSLG
jgi:hypothetical protein